MQVKRVVMIVVRLLFKHTAMVWPPWISHQTQVNQPWIGSCDGPYYWLEIRYQVVINPQGPQGVTRGKCHLGGQRIVVQDQDVQNIQVG